MASKHQETAFEDDIYENVGDVTTRHKNVTDMTTRRGSDTDETEHRGSSSAEESSGASSFNWADERRPPAPPLKLRISSSESRPFAKYSYDEVSVNFGKPVILGVADKNKEDNEEDIFGSVTFQSPIQDLSVEEKEILFKVARPVPAPRPSKTHKQSEKEEIGHQHKDDIEIDDKIYEDPDELKTAMSSLEQFSKYPPQVPPRNNAAPENTPKSLNSKNNSYENVYCEIRPQISDKSKTSKVENIMDRTEGQAADEEDDIPARLGARPRTKRY
jgi:hypothetical protein